MVLIWLRDESLEDTENLGMRDFTLFIIESGVQRAYRKIKKGRVHRTRPFLIVLVIIFQCPG